MGLVHAGKVFSNDVAFVSTALLNLPGTKYGADVVISLNSYTLESRQATRGRDAHPTIAASPPL